MKKGRSSKLYNDRQSDMKRCAFLKLLFAHVVRLTLKRRFAACSLDVKTVCSPRGTKPQCIYKEPSSVASPHISATVGVLPMFRGAKGVVVIAYHRGRCDGTAARITVIAISHH